MSNNIKEAIKKNDHGYFECPSGCGAVYHQYSFTHNPYICKDCNQEFSIPEGVKLNKPKPFKKRVKKPARQGA